MRPLKSITVFLTVAMLGACAGPDRAPEEVAEAFWLAVLSQDLDGVRDNSTQTSASEVDLSMLDFSTTVTFGEATLAEDSATVITLLQDPSSEEAPVSVDTLLALEDGEWRVDAVQTLDDARVGLSSGFVSDLRELSDEIQRELEEAVQELREEMPELRQELEELGKVADELRQSLNEQVPVIQQEVDELLRALQEILEDNASEPAGDEEAEPAES